jgi:hypothetical protein
MSNPDIPILDLSVLKLDSKEQASIDSAKHFLFAAMKSLYEFKTDDYLDLIDSYNMECKELDDLSVEAGCDHWEEYAFQYMWLYFLHANATYLNAFYLIMTDQCQEKDIYSADGLMSVLLEQSRDFARKVAPALKGTVFADDKLFDLTHASYLQLLKQFYLKKNGKSI